jgi:hypothetical protein
MKFTGLLKLCAGKSGIHPVILSYILHPVMISYMVLGELAVVKAQQVQIPTLQVCNQTEVNGTGIVEIDRRQDAKSKGFFSVSTNLSCSSKTGYPTGTLTINTLSMNDSVVNGPITEMSVEQITTTGKYTPTAYLNGRCKAKDASGKNITGCKFWMMIADNNQTNPKGTADIVGFLVVDASGKRIAYGTGPLSSGDIYVSPTSY